LWSVKLIPVNVNYIKVVILDQQPNVEKCNAPMEYTDKWYINGKRNARIFVKVQSSKSVVVTTFKDLFYSLFISDIVFILTYIAGNLMPNSTS